MVNEFVVLMLLGAASVSLAWILKLRDFWLLLPAGLLGVTTFRAMSFAVLNALNLRDLANPFFYGALFVILVVAAWTGTRELYGPLWKAVAIALVAATYTRVFNFTTVPESDSLWILSATRLFDEGANLSKLTESTSMQRGFAYPLMLALGEPGEFLTGFTPLLFGALICATIWAFRVLVPAATDRVNRNGRLALTLAVSFAAASTAMVLRAVFYVNSHNLTAIAVLLAAIAIAVAFRDQHLSRGGFVVLAVSLIAMCLTSLEGPAFALVLMSPLVTRSWIRRREVLALVSASTIAFLIWLLSYETQVVNESGLPPWLFGGFVFILVAGMAFVVASFPLMLRRQLIWLVPTVLGLAIAACWLFAPERMSLGAGALLTNLFGGSGDWGALAYLVGIGFLLLGLSGFQAWSEEFKSLTWTLATMILAAIVVKTFASNSSGKIGLRQFAWSDSLNRLWFEIMAVALVTLIVGTTQRAKL